MGILNVTPDSFSDGGRYIDPSRAVDQALELIADGADLIDVGGESTRPGAEPVPVELEIARTAAVIGRLTARTNTPISIDTMKAAVARRALDAGAVIVNDVSGLTHDPAMTTLCAQSGAGLICMHMQGTPQSMQVAPQYENAVSEIADYLRARLRALEAEGVLAERVVLDPGIGFGKTAGHNLDILRNVAAFREIGRPVLIGHSRKGFLKQLLGRPIDERQSGTIGVSIAAALSGADLLRVHDVRATRDALVACAAILGPS